MTSRGRGSFYTKQKPTKQIQSASSSAGRRRLELDLLQDFEEPTPPAPPNSTYWTPGQTIPSTGGNASSNSVDSQPQFIRESYHFSPNAYHASIRQDTPCSSRQTVPQGAPLSLSGSSAPWNEILESQKRLESLISNVLQRVTTLENTSLLGGERHVLSPHSTSSFSTGSEKEKPQRIPPELSVSCVFKFINEIIKIVTIL